MEGAHPKMITVIVVDDHPMVRAGMRAVLDAAGDLTVYTIETGRGHEVVVQMLREAFAASWSRTTSLPMTIRR